MLSGWTVLTCIGALVVVAPVHLSLWLPLTDRRLHWESSQGHMSVLTARLVFSAAVGLHLIWTLLSSGVLTPGIGTLLGLIAANVLLSPFFFTASCGVWLHWCILRQPDCQPWLGVGEAPAEQDDELPSVTVVIACRNEPFEVVLMTLTSAFSLKYPRRKLAFIVADNSDEDHPDFPALCREVEDRKRRGEPIELLHRRGTRGFKAGNLDMAIQVARSDLLLFLDVDNTVPEDLLMAHADPLSKNPESSYLQFFNIVSNGHASLVAATAASDIGYAKYRDLALSDLLNWSFFQGHACLWKRHALLRVAPFSQYLHGESVMTEDSYFTFRASRLGFHGHACCTPSAYWAPLSLESFAKMTGRWNRGTLQCYAKDIGFILSHSMGYGDAGGYAALWYRFWQLCVVWLIPILAVFLPFSWEGGWLIAGLWAITCLLPPLFVMGLRSDANAGGITAGPQDLLRQHLIYLFQAWSHCHEVTLFALGGGAGWVQTPKTLTVHASPFSWLDMCSRFKAALLFSLLAPGLALAWKGLLFGEPLLSPATLPLLYLSGGITVSIALFAPPRPAPTAHGIQQCPLPSWTGRVAMAVPPKNE